MYEVHSELLNSCQHGGVPQNRPRLYIVGIATAAKRDPGSHFTWPAEIDYWHLRTIIGRNKGKDVLPPVSQRVARRNCALLHERLRDEGYSVKTAYAMFNIDGSSPSMMIGLCPCITRTRGDII